MQAKHRKQGKEKQQEGQVVQPLNGLIGLSFNALSSAYHISFVYMFAETLKILML